MLTQDLANLFVVQAITLLYYCELSKLETDFINRTKTKAKNLIQESQK